MIRIENNTKQKGEGEIDFYKKSLPLDCLKPVNKRRIDYLIRLIEYRNLRINPHKTPFLTLSLF